MKILRWGQKSIHDNSPWIVGKWCEEPDAPADGEPCGVGFHSIICGDPLKSPVFVWPCAVWEDECQEELGRDAIKARFRRQRILHEVTNQFPVIVAVNKFIAIDIPTVKWFQPQSPEPWMIVQQMKAFAAARNAAKNAAFAAARNAAFAVAKNAAFAAARNAAKNAAFAAAGAAAFAVAKNAAFAAAGNAAFAAARNAERDALSLLVADLPIDTTWLRRWWRAWELGYWPLAEQDDKLIVAEIVR